MYHIAKELIGLAKRLSADRFVTYKKLRDGSWGLHGPVRELRKGKVNVHTKSGREHVELVGKILWDNGDIGIATKGESDKGSQKGRGGASDRQVSAIRKMLRSLERVDMFDSMPGSGSSVAEEISKELRRKGGIDGLSRQEASDYIETLKSYLDDEM